MRLLFAIIISLFSNSTFADGGHLAAFLSMPIAAALAPLQFQYREGGRHWTSQELDKNNINSSFNTWLICYRNPGNPVCNNCDTHQDQNVIEIENLARDKCLPARNDLAVAYADHLDPELRKIRDDNICGCYRERGAGPIGDLAFSLGSDNESQEAARAERHQLQARQQSLQEGILKNLTLQRLVTERFQTSFSAASYSENSSEAVSLGALYSQMKEHEHEDAHRAVSAVSAGAAGIAAAAHAAVISNAEHEAVSRPITSNDFTSENLLSRPGYCVPYRHFLASKQYPVEQSFYDDLSRQDDFDWKDWNYPILLKQFHNVVGERTIKNALNNDPKGKANRMYQRIKFLYDNPVFKNIFQSDRNDQNNRAVIRSLIGIIRRMSRPVCNINGCTQDEASNSRLRDYRTEMAAFLRRPEVISASQMGAESSHGAQIQIAVASAQSAIFSDVLNPASEAVDASKWRAFCDEKAVQADALKSRDVNFVMDLEGAIGRRDFEDPTRDKEYAEMNNEVCTVARTGSSGQKTFQQFFTDICGTRTSGECSVEARPNLVGRFLREFPNSTSSKAESYGNLATFLGGSGQVAAVSSANIQTYNEISSDPVLARNSLNSESSVVTSQRNVAAVQGSVSPSQVDSPVNNTVFSQPQQLIVPQTQAQAAPDVAAPRNSLAQSETEAQLLRNEIASLQNVLRRDPTDAGAQKSPSTRTLTQKLDTLMKKLADQEEEIESLRNNWPSQDDSEAAPSRAETQAPSSNASRSAAPSTVQAIIPQGGAPAGAAAFFPSTSGNSFSGISSVAPTRVSPAASRYSALLSRFGFREVSEQGGITVASTSGSIDYQKLRSETENSILPLTVTSEEFNLISQNNQGALSRYLDQVRALPGEVVRINLSSGDRTMEIFVLKNGNQISFVPPPASAASDRTHMLKTLQTELLR